MSHKPPKFNPAQLAYLERLYGASVVKPGVSIEQIMYEAGAQAVVRTVARNLSGPREVILNDPDSPR